ncbi:MAG: LysR family transcriptional regulator [Thermoleophilia bacterium]
MLQPELRLVRYFVAVAEERNFTRAAERLGMAQPPLSAAIAQLEAQLGTRLLERTSRDVRPTAAGELLLASGRDLLARADEAFAAVRAVEHEPRGLLRVGFSPAGRFRLAPRLLACWAEEVPGVMVHTREDTTGALLRDVAQGRLDLALAFCLPPVSGVETELLRAEPAVLHVREDHPLIGRGLVAVDDLADQVLLIAGGRDSPGYTATVLELCREAGIAPATRPDPYPDLGVQAVREGLGVVIYVATAFPTDLPGSRLLPMEAGVTLPFHLAWRTGARSAALQALVAAARAAFADESHPVRADSPRR